MYATSGLEDVIGIPAASMHGRSFYYCIAENCLQDAVKCLENAKGNDSIAYLRFWFRDPRIDDGPPAPDEDSDEEMTTEASEDTDGGGVGLQTQPGTSPDSAGSSASNAVHVTPSMEMGGMEGDMKPESRTSSGDSTRAADTHEAIFGESRRAESLSSSLHPSPERTGASPRPAHADPLELEAVISCTSDGLVVCLRKAKPMIPHPTQRPSRPAYQNGLFAAPWAVNPILPPIDARPGAGFGSAFAPALGPHGARHNNSSPQRVGGPPQQDFMSAIRDQAIFAWALTGINGALAEYGQGKPLGESMPQDGLPVWASDPRQLAADSTNRNGWHSGQEMFGSSSRSPQDGRPGAHIFGDPGLDRNGSRSASNGYGSSGQGTPFAR